MPTSQLPPLILHPFSDDPAGPGKLLNASRASLVLQGLLPAEDVSAEELDLRLLEGRYCEIRMLYYLGKDLLRWISQCMEVVARTPELERDGVRAESFAALLVEIPPLEVERKLRAWGVHDHKAIFARALGIHAVFDSLPDVEALAANFVRYYHRFADHMYSCRQLLFPFKRPDPGEFDFELYASGEYTRMLEKEWDGA